MGYEDNLPLDTSEFIEVEVSLAEATYDGLEMGADDAVAVNSLTAEDAEALEQGIVDMFESLRGEIQVSENAYGDDVYDDDDSDDDVEPTFALLAELNRIWSQPLAA